MTESVQVIGIGASAGGLDALVKFFSAAPSRTGAAYVVVQHLSAEHRSLMPELLARHTTMPVLRATDDMPLAPDTVFLMPPQQDMSIVDGRLRMQPRQEGGVHHPIDFFFTSLAASLGPRAAGVVLSGTGRDGTNGAMSLHESGAIVAAQDPTTASFDGMPSSVVNSGIADFVLPPERLPEAIVQALQGNGIPDSGPEADAHALNRIVSVLSRDTRIDFTEYKSGTLARRVHRRQHELGLADVSAYRDYLLDHPAELQRLGCEVLIGVSSFFRDPGVFEKLASDAIPQILGQDRFDGTVRAWVPGCSSGQEAYSVAMLLLEAIEQLDTGIRVKVFATDVDASAVERGANGIFSFDVAEQISPARLTRFFQRTHDGWRVVRSLRQSVVFSVHNALRDPPFSRLDLITCRNLLIYLQASAQRNLMARCAMSLKLGGFLALGPSEALGEISSLFDVVDARAKLFRRRAGSLPAGVIAPATGWSPTRSSAPTELSEQLRAVDEAYRELARLDSPVSLVLDPAGQIVHATGDTREFFSLPVGRVSLDAVKLARGGLSTLLSAALARVQRERKAVEYGDIDVRLEQGTARLGIRVVPLTEASFSGYVVVSVRRAPTNDRIADRDAAGQPSFEHLDVLQQELTTTRENLQAAIEELETANEELQAANEELLASNEELQATNEELQATNEELFTANAESERRIADLVELNADIDNLLRSTDIGTLFLDSQLDIRKFTPALTDFIPVLERDIGRPIAHVNHRLADVDLVDLGRRVIATENREDLPARAGDRRLLLRAVPYRISGKTAGVVISFVDVTDLALARETLAGVMDALPEQIAVLDGDGRISHLNHSWLAFGRDNGADPAAAHLGVEYAEIIRAGLADDPTLVELQRGLQRVLRGDDGHFAMPYRCDSPTEERHFMVHVSRLGNAGGAVVSHVDVTPVARTAAAVARSAEFYRRLFEISETPILLVAPDTLQVIECNEHGRALISGAEDGTTGRSLDEFLDCGSRGWPAVMRATREAGSSPTITATTGSGTSLRTVELSLHMVSREGEELCLVRLREPLTATLLGEREGLRSRINQSQKMESLGVLAGGVAHELNNVLTAIVGITAARREGLGSGDPFAADLDAVLSACARGADLTRNLLGFARRGSVAREHFGLGDVLNEVIGLLRSSVRPGVKLVAHVLAPAAISGDRSQVAQSLMNLCMNALDAVAEHGEVEVSLDVARPPGGGANEQMALLRVSDNGVGMDEATREQAFDPFFTTKPRGTGTGLGLSMVYGVVKSHGGCIDIASSPGRGTTVTLGFPLARELVPAVRVDAPRGAGRRVLVVDDDDLVRRSMRRLLESQGFTVEDVDSGAAAIERVGNVGSPEIEVVLLDVVMPKLDGLATLESLRTTHPRLGVLLYSGYPDRAPHQTLEVDPFTAFCTKPIERVKLLQTLDALMHAGIATAAPSA
ncbi:MAG: response regulator [Nannocystaceae bacterium]|nr:response regulator [Nannocystaceae bacterium]